MIYRLGGFPLTALVLASLSCVLLSGGARAEEGTLDGAGVTIIPHIHPEAAPRYRVTLQVTTGDPSDPPAKRA